MNDVCLVLLILLLIIVVTRNSDVEKFENIKEEIEIEKEEMAKKEVKETPKAPKKLKNSGENLPPKVQQVPEPENVPGAFLPEKINGYEDGDLFASYAEDYGDVVPLSMQSDYAILSEKNILKPNLMANIQEERSPGFISDSQTPPFDPTARSGLMAVGQYDEGVQKESGGSKSAEVHFVYAEWCGHSQNAIPAFEELTKMSDVKTQSGIPVTFVMTEEQSDEFSQFKGKVKGFPTYMTVLKENGEVKSLEELLVQSRSKEGILEAAKELV
jgi:thiol-disulfide isomerase/thioredoxin